MVRLATGLDMRPEGADCEHCGLNTMPYVASSGPERADYATVGEAPGDREMALGRPWVGPAGRLRNQALGEAGIDYRDVFGTNAVLCRPMPHREPTEDELRRCRPRLLRELAEHSPKLTILLGNPALRTVFGMKKRIGQERGRIARAPWGWTIASWHPAAVLRNGGLYRTLVEDLRKGKEFLEGGETPRPELIRRIATCSSDLRLVEAAFSREVMGFLPLTVDFENASNGDPLCFGVGRYRVDGNILVWTILPELIGDPGFREIFNGRYVAGANVKYDYERFQELGIDTVITCDPALMHYTLDERHGTHSLEDMVDQEYGREPEIEWWRAFKPKRKKLEELAPEAVQWYNAMDVYYTVRLAANFGARMDERNIRVYSDILIPISPVLARMEMRGTQIDLGTLHVVKVDYTARRASQEEKLITLCGKPEFNPNSFQQAARILFDERGLPDISGKRSTDVEFLAQLTEDEFVRELLEYRRLNKLVGTYLEGIEKRLDSQHRIHTHFNIHGTVTGRLSSSDPNLQNIPIRGENEREAAEARAIRNLFIASSGYTWLKADFSQAEIRVLAYYSKDPKLLRIIESGQDLHIGTACILFGRKPEEVSKLLRGMAKTINFAVIYGAEARTVREKIKTSLGIDISRNRAQEIIDLWFNQFDVAAEWLLSVKTEVINNHEYTTPLGWVRRWPTVNAKELREATNTPIQSLAAHITLKALIRLDRVLPATDRLLLTVHDENDLETRRDIMECGRQVKQVMLETANEVVHNEVPFEVEISVGQRWGDLEVLKSD